MHLDTWLIYLLACIGLSLSPGPNGLLALTHGAIYGTRRTLLTIAGGAIGFVLIIALSMFGIGALLKQSVFWFALLKWIGGFYLIYLGVQLWRSPAIALDLKPLSSGRAGTLFRQGAFSALSNPKALLFFGAFLPQFIEPSMNLMSQFLVMAGTFVVTEMLTELVLALAAQHIRPWLSRSGRTFNRICGGLFAAIGVALPLRP